MSVIQHDVFISYSRHDGHKHAKNLHNTLEDSGYSVWRDERDIDPFQDFTAEIEMGIRASKVIAVCVTDDTTRPDSFVRREIQYGLALKKPVIPCRFDDVIPHISIINNEWLNFYEDFRKYSTRLREIISNPQITQTIERVKSVDDPYRDYLQDLYNEFVELLDITVFKLIADIEARHTPEKVGQSRRTRRRLTSAFRRHGIGSGSQTEITNFNDAFEEYNGRLLLLGDPGAGKTTALYAFGRDAVVKRLNDPTEPLPIFERIATWTTSPPRPITKWLSNDSLSEHEIKKLIQNDEALLLLDGLDELGETRTERVRIPNLNEIHDVVYDPRERFIQFIPDSAKVVISCRVKDYEAIDKKIQTLNGAVTLQQLNDRQIRNYLYEMPDLWFAINSDKHLMELVRIPLLLSIITFAYRDRGNELRQLNDLNGVQLRDHIFDTYLTVRYEYENDREDTDIPVTLDELKAYLGQLAMNNIGTHRKGGGPPISDNVILLSDFPRKNLNIHKPLGLKLHILLERDNNTFGFIHLLIRDVLAHQFALRNLKNYSLYDYDTHLIPNPANTLAVTGDIKEAKLLLPLVKYNSKQSFSSVSALEFFGRKFGWKQLKDALQQENNVLESTTIPNLIKIVLRHRNYAHRVRASNILMSVDALPQILSVFISSPPGTSQNSGIANILRQVEWNPIEFSDVVPHLVASQQWEILVKVGKKGINRLLPLLTAQDISFRANIINILGKIGDESVVNHLSIYLKDQTRVFSSFRICDAAEDALRMIGTEEALEAIERHKGK